ncbi:unnamed protein product [Closterium sp. NIES-65]|nr:unnamed protein product [Closterium sp. NIES-65]
MISRLTTGLRAHEKEERKRVAATQLHLTEEVEQMLHLVMGGPTDDTTKALLLDREEQLEAYRENERERLKVFAGLTEELQGEIPLHFLSAKVKMRKERTVIEEVRFKGERCRGPQAVLKAASAHFAEAFNDGQSGLRDFKATGDGNTARVADYSGNGPAAQEGRERRFNQLQPDNATYDGLQGTGEGAGEQAEARAASYNLEGTTRVHTGTQYAVALVADAIEAADNDGEDWYLLLVDFQKAYDTVSRSFLFKTLEKLGLPGQFVKWTEGLHKGSETRLAINGWLGKRVEMQRGVRQGCPLAPYLFLCALEPLCAEIRSRGLGVKAEGGEAVSYVGYAGDTSLILKREDQLHAAAGALDWFGEMSGLHINRDKSIVMPLGMNKGITTLPGVTFKWAETGVLERLLGVWVTPNGEAAPSWEKAWEKGKKELAKWESHHLLTAARVTIINNYIMPILLFQAQIYPPPEELWEKIRKMCDNYVSKGEATGEKIFVLWSGELARLPKKEGGLGLVDPKEEIDSLAMRQVGKFLTEQNVTKLWLSEKAAALPQRVATFFAHKTAGRHWEKGSKRWKAIAEVFWESPFADLPALSNGWEAERELLCFNRRIMFRGGEPVREPLGGSRNPDNQTGGPAYHQGRW